MRVPEGALVVDVGAFEGDFTAYARQTWNARVLAVEPVPEFAKALERRFEHDRRVTVVEAALGDSAGTVTMSVEDDGSSAWGSGDVVVAVPSMDVTELLQTSEVALLKMNAEGAEYDVLERLLVTQMIQQVATIQVQFHKFVPDARHRRRSIRARLRQTHRCTWSVPWVWEQWQRRAVVGSGPKHE